MKAKHSPVHRWLLAACILLVLACGFQSARAYYDPTAGHFLSADPLGHAASMDLHSFCDGDPINRFDPTGRFGKSVGDSLGNVGPTWWDEVSRQIDNDNYNNSSAGQFMQGYQQTQAEMASTLSWQSEPPTWGEFFSSALNMVPAAGGVKMWIEGGFTGKDMVTGQQVNRSSWETFFGVTGNALGTVGMMGGIMSEAAQSAKFANGFASWQARSSGWESQLGVAKAGGTATQLEFGFVDDIRPVLFKGSAYNPSQLRPGEFQMHLPNLRNEALNWQQNFGELKQFTDKGISFRELNPLESGGWLQRERNHLFYELNYDRVVKPDGVFWSPKP